MPKYLFVYHGGGMPETQEERDRVMAAWGAWFQDLGESIVDGGNPTGASKTVQNGSVADGGGANPASGYSLVNAADMDDAVKKAQGCPILAGGGSVEVAETFEIPM